MEHPDTSPIDMILPDAPSEPDRSQGSQAPRPTYEEGHEADEVPPLGDALPAVPTEHRRDLETPPDGTPVLPHQPSVRRGLIYLALCIAFALALVLPNLFGSASSSASAPCNEGAVLSQVVVVPGPSGDAPILLAVVRPQPYPNIAPGDEPGCDALYRSDDNGLTWTVSFSATAEAPASLALAPSSGQLYLLTQRMHFPLYLAGNIYRSDHQAMAWTWGRVSPQGRHDVPMVSATGMLILDDGSVILREGNGDGAALVISQDGGTTWQPLVIPQLRSVGSMATLRNQIAVTQPLLMPGQAPGMVSDDHGMRWQSMGPLPDMPLRGDLRPILSADVPEHALVLDLVPSGVVGQGGTVARYYSLDGGLRWTRVHCGAQPAPGCAVAVRWAQAAGIRYVLYHGQVFQQPPGGAWKPLPAPLPVASAAVLQLSAAADGARPVLYLVTATGLWRWDGVAWQRSATGLPLGGPTPTIS